MTTHNMDCLDCDFRINKVSSAPCIARPQITLKLSFFFFFVAAKGGRLDICQCLLTARADLTARDRNGKMAFQLAQNAAVRALLYPGKVGFVGAETPQAHVCIEASGRWGITGGNLPW